MPNMKDLVFCCTSLQQAHIELMGRALKKMKSLFFVSPSLSPSGIDLSPLAAVTSLSLSDAQLGSLLHLPPKLLSLMLSIDTMTQCTSRKRGIVKFGF